MKTCADQKPFSIGSDLQMSNPTNITLQRFGQHTPALGDGFWTTRPSENGLIHNSRQFHHYCGSAGYLAQACSIEPLFAPTTNPDNRIGKTILASLVIEEAQKLKPTPTVLFFYCKHKNSERDNFNAVARSLLAQLLKQDRDMLPYFYERCCESGEAVLDSRALIEELLKLAFDNCKSAYIILDGLDECARDERKEITQWFRKLVEDLPTSEPERLRCLFVSQDDGVARKDFSGLANIKIKSEDNKHDINLYSRIEADKLKLTFNLAEERAAGIASTVANSVEGN